MGVRHSSSYSSSGSGSIDVGDCCQGKGKHFHGRCGRDPQRHKLFEEEHAARAAILKDYTLEASRLSHRHPLSAQSIASYSTENHLVFIRHGKAYDATSWFERHPGGKFVMLKYAGQDISEVFDRFHSRRTKNEFLKEVFIGNVWTGQESKGSCFGWFGGVGVGCNGSISSNDQSQSHIHGHGHSHSHSHHGHHGHSHNSDHQHHGGRGRGRGGRGRGRGRGGGGCPECDSVVGGTPVRSGLSSPFSILSSPVESDYGDHEGRVVRVKTLTPDCSVIRMYVAYPERLTSELGGSIVIKRRGVARNYSLCYVEETNFSLVIKRYELGIVSNYLFSKKVGDCLQFDGPFSPKTPVPDRPFKAMLLIGQGTGVVPVLEVARTVIADTIFFVSCYSRITDVLFSKELSLLPDNVRLIYFIPTADLKEDADKVPGLLFNSRLTPELLRAAMSVAGGPSVSLQKSTNNSPPTLSEPEVPSPSKQSPASLIDATFICSSCPFFEDVQMGLVDKLGLSKESITQL